MNDKISSEELTRLANNLDDEMKRFDERCAQVSSTLLNIGVHDFKTDYYHQGSFLADNPGLKESEDIVIGEQFKKYSEGYTKARELVKAKFGLVRDKMREYVRSSTEAQVAASKDLEGITATLDSTQDMFN